MARLRQYRFRAEDIVAVGHNVIDGQNLLLVEARSVPRRFGVVTQTAPKRHPSYRARHKRRRGA